MARAKRHYIPGQIWHITHRRHKRDFLLGFVRDRRNFLQWLLEAKRRYGLVILNYIVTSNHIHLLVVDDSDREVIPKSIQLIAGRTGQEYNQRKNRKGAYWEDRYHATAIESGEHLLRCIIYIDLNMTRAGKVHHPEEWHHSGYREIQQPRRKHALIAYDRLQALAGFNSYEAFRMQHKAWVSDAISNAGTERDSKWTRSIAVGSKEFVEQTKAELGIQAKGRKVSGRGDVFQLRESVVAYNVDSGTKNNVIEPQNAYFWNKDEVIAIR